jgi:hypothetical protein
MKIYKVYAFSYWCMVIQIILGFILPIMTISDTFGIQFWIIYGVANLLAYFLAVKFGLKQIEVSFDAEEITFKYIRSRTRKIKIKSIKEFSDFNFGGNLTFKLKLISTNYTLYKSGIWSRNDDFEDLILDFKNFILNPVIDSPNSTGLSNISNRQIEYNNFFKTKPATLLFYISSFTTAILVYSIITDKIVDSAGALISIGGLVGYSVTYLAKRNDD